MCPEADCIVAAILFRFYVAYAVLGWRIDSHAGTLTNIVAPADFKFNLKESQTGV